eukprot:scaffold42136_cov36-Phaeocystis_antarctica.AAC.1
MVLESGRWRLAELLPSKSALLEDRGFTFSVALVKVSTLNAYLPVDSSWEMVASPYATAILSLFCAVTTVADTAQTVDAAQTAALKIPDPDICEVGGSGYVFPLFGDDEAAWPKPLRGILYGIGTL